MDIRGEKRAHPTMRRIGKKAIFYDKLAPKLGIVDAADKKPRRWKLKLPKLTKRRAITAVCILIATGLITGGVLWYRHDQTVRAQAAAAEEAKKQQVINEKAQICYQQKQKERADMLGKVTYDQLYDGNSCYTQAAQ